MSAATPFPREATRSALHVAARKLAERGVPVFPCSPGTKVPACPNGFHDATTDVAVIDEWWSAEPSLNVAFSPHTVELGVVDIDGQAGEDRWAERQIEHGFSADTYEVRTPRGGRHLYFRGVLPATQSKLADHIDTRGVGSYVLAPPSVIDARCGKPADHWGRYEALNDLAPTTLPEWIPAHLAQLQREHAKAAVDDLDQPANVARAERLLRDYVKRGMVAKEGEMGDGRTFAVACELQNLGLSADTAFDLLDEIWNPACLPPWDLEELRTKVDNASRYAQNEPGAWAVEPASEVFAAALANLPADDPAPAGPEHGGSEWEARVSRFRALEPDEYADLADIEFWEDDGILPKIPGGCVGVAYGASGAGKTTVLATILVEAMRRRQAHVVYCAGEGAHALRKARIPAVCEAQAITPHDLRRKLQLLDTVPNLNDALDAEALIEAQAAFKPDIVVIDTLATAIPGANENDASTGSHLTGNGAGGRLAKTFAAAVIFVAHSGKDQARGVRGSSAFTANADFVWQITSDKEAGTVRLRVEKMRDGPDGFSVYFKVSPATNGVPVARRISKSEHAALTATGLSADRQDVAKALRRLGPEPVTTYILASALIPPEPNQREEDREKLVKAEVHRLQRLARSAKDGSIGRLAGYVAHASTGTRDPMLWAMPFASNDDDDDGGDDD